jgi:hypothetical protein
MKQFFRAMQVMSIVTTWSAAALADGRITAAEAFDLLQQLAGALGIPLSFKIGDLDAEAANRVARSALAPGASL